MAIALFVGFVIVIFLSFLFNLNFHKVWFSFFLGFIGIYLSVRAFFFHLDSNYLLGFNFLGFAIISALNFFYLWQFFLALYFLWASVVFLLTFLIFRQNIYLILFALTLIEVLLLVINKLFLNIFIFVFFQTMLVILMFIIFIFATKIKKEKKGAISNN